jgi:hypothetical protein
LFSDEEPEREPTIGEQAHDATDGVFGTAGKWLGSLVGTGLGALSPLPGAVPVNTAAGAGIGGAIGGAADYIADGAYGLVSDVFDWF